MAKRPSIGAAMRQDAHTPTPPTRYSAQCSTGEPGRKGEHKRLLPARSEGVFATRAG